jgi:Uma2 family endonuclease
MATSTLITHEQYEHMVFEHDAEFVEGRVVERPMPTAQHSIMQGFLIRVLHMLMGLQALPELRLRTRPDRTRVPDVCLIRIIPYSSPTTIAPYLCVEILSPEDRMIEVLTKVSEYLEMGVEFVWIVDPVSFTGEIRTKHDIKRVTNGIFTAGDITIDIGDASA